MYRKQYDICDRTAYLAVFTKSCCSSFSSLINMAKETELPQIPPEILQEILPDKNLSILDFLKFHLPAAAQAIDGSNQLQNFLSSTTPTITSIDEIRTIPTPPLAVLNLVLNKLVKAPDLSALWSVLFPHAPGLIGERLPIWVISYWVQVSHLRSVKKKWLEAEEALRKQEHSKGRTDHSKGLIKQVYNMLACISWASNINRFSASITTDHLATYLTKDWFSDEHKNQMLYLLQQEVSRERRDDGIDICDTFFVKRLIDLQKDTAGPDRYAMASSYAWLRVKGQELAMGVLETLAMIANIGDDHWIALILDFKSSTIC